MDYQFKTLKEVKQSLRDENTSIRAHLKEIAPTASRGINRKSGFVHQTSNYETVVAYQAHLEFNKRFLKMLSGVRRLK